MGESLSPVDTIVLSPHLDDAALSCGGEIHQAAQAGRRVLVVSVFAGRPPLGDLSALAREVHDRFDLDSDVVGARRGEDDAACRILGAEPLHGDIAEAIYRRDPLTSSPIYHDIHALFARPLANDPAMAAVEALLRALPPARRVLAPLAVGRHVDHQILRGAAGRVVGAACLFYEDYPYVQKWLALRRALGWTNSLVPEVVPLGESDVQARIDAIAAYRSQVQPLFGGAARVAERVHAAVTRVGGERRWRARRERV